jgi:hypothetical protein
MIRFCRPSVQSRFVGWVSGPLLASKKQYPCQGYNLLICNSLLEWVQVAIGTVGSDACREICPSLSAKDYIMAQQFEIKGKVIDQNPEFRYF